MAVSIAEARRLVLGHAAALDGEGVALDDALGRVLLGAVAAPGDVPPFHASAMDGYALRSADTQAPRARLAVVGESRAGALGRACVQAGTAMRISTGAPVPEGADAVVRQELTTLTGDVIEVDEPIPVGNDVRFAGEDVRKGDVVLRSGTVLGPAELGVLSSLDVARPVVARRPRVAIVGTGDELVDPGEPLAPGTIRDSNGPMLAGAVRGAGGEVASRARVGDDLEATVAALGAALHDADVLITAGGVSVGPHDHVRPALARLGATEVFAGVDLKPGRPTTFAVAPGGALIFALAGNPVSALMGFRLFALPGLDALQGRTRPPKVTTAIAAAALPGVRGRTAVVRCRAEMRPDGWHVTPTKEQESHVLTSMLDVDVLALVPPDRGAVSEGEEVAIEFA